jgi:hypothetical protein
MRLIQPLSTESRNLALHAIVALSLGSNDPRSRRTVNAGIHIGNVFSLLPWLNIPFQLLTLLASSNTQLAIGSLKPTLR